MILTPKFVFIANPKTGSTSAESLIFHAWLARPFILRLVEKTLVWMRIIQPRVRRLLVKGTNGVRHKHGNFTQIPKSHQNLPVLATFREPLEWIMSHVKYENPVHIARNILRKEAPKDIVEIIDNYLEYAILLRRKHEIENEKIGYFTYAFIRQFHNNPEQLFDKLASDYHCFSDCFGEITFMHFPYQIGQLKEHMRRLNFCRSTILRLPENIHKNKSNNTLTLQEEQLLKKYIENHEPLLTLWHEEFTKHT